MESRIIPKETKYKENFFLGGEKKHIPLSPISLYTDNKRSDGRIVETNDDRHSLR